LPDKLRRMRYDGTLDPQSRANLIGLGLFIVLALMMIAIWSGHADLRGTLQPAPAAWEAGE